jgi:hypothetical protein
MAELLPKKKKINTMHLNGLTNVGFSGIIYNKYRNAMSENNNM